MRISDGKSNYAPFLGTAWSHEYDHQPQKCSRTVHWTRTTATRPRKDPPRLIYVLTLLRPLPIRSRSPASDHHMLQAPACGDPLRPLGHFNCGPRRPWVGFGGASHFNLHARNPEASSYAASQRQELACSARITGRLLFIASVPTCGQGRHVYRQLTA